MLIFFLGPFYSLSSAASEQAEDLHTLVMLTEGDRFNNTSSNYTLSISPTLYSFCATCLNAAKTALIANDESSNATVFLVYNHDTYVVAQESISVIISYGLELIGELFYNKSISYTEIVSIIRAANPRIVLGGGVGDESEYIQALRKEIGSSKGSWDPLIITFSVAFPNNEWWEEGILYPQTWTSSLLTSDYYFGNAQNFSNLFETVVGRAPYYFEASVVAAVLTINNLINITQSLDSAELVAYAKSGLDLTDSFYGEISFDGISIARPFICTQNQAHIYPIVDPPELATLTVNLNPIIVYPPGFFSTHGKDNTLRNALIASLVSTFGIICIVLLTSLIVIKKYHLIFIPKKDVF